MDAPTSPVPMISAGDICSMPTSVVAQQLAEFGRSDAAERAQLGARPIKYRRLQGDAIGETGGGEPDGLPESGVGSEVTGDRRV